MNRKRMDVYQLYYDYLRLYIAINYETMRNQNGTYFLDTAFFFMPSHFLATIPFHFLFD